MSKKQQIDFPELEGIVLTRHVDNDNKDTMEVIVANCHRDVGITLVYKDDKERNAYCLSKKGSNPKWYDQQFEWLLICIEKREIHRNDDPNPAEHFGASLFSSQVDCAFL